MLDRFNVGMVSEAFIHQCKREELVTSRVMLHGKKGLCFADVCKLKRIRHLHEDMGLDLAAVDFVLRNRRRIKRCNAGWTKWNGVISRLHW